MRIRVLALVLTVGLVGLAAASSAETLLFEGNLSLEGLGAPAVADTAIGVATVNGSGGGANITSLALPGGLFSLSTTVIPSATTLPISGIELTLMAGAGTLMAATPSAPLLGPLPVPGNVRICIFLSCDVNQDVPLTENGTRGVGLGGPPIVRTGLITLSAVGEPWADQTVAITTTTSAGTSVTSVVGFAHGPVSNTGTTAAVDGVIQMVTPVRIVAPTVGTTIPTFGIINIRFLPEPGVFGLFAAGALAVAILGTRRR